MRSSLETCRCINKTVLKHNADSDNNDEQAADDDDNDDDDVALAWASSASSTLIDYQKKNLKQICIRLETYTMDNEQKQKQLTY